MKDKIRLLLLITFYTLSALMINAQDKLTFLDWNLIATDTLCPVYSEVVPLESDYNSNDYRIILEYPTWDKLSSQELALAKRYSHCIGDSITIDHYLSISKGQGLLNYHFVPIIKKGKEYKKLVSAKVIISPVPKPSLARKAPRSTNRYAEHSVLASGNWKTIHITKDGIYSLSPAFLAKMGFNNPDNVHLYGYGGHQQSELLDADNDFDDLEEIPLYRASNGNLLFWGNGLVHWNGTERIFNAYANKATYFLCDGAKRKEISTANAYIGATSQTVTTTLGHALHEVDNFAWFRAGRNLVESTLFSGAQTKTYTLNGIKSLGNEKLTVVFTGSDVSTPLTIWANGIEVAQKTISAPGSYMYFSEAKYPNMDVSRMNPGSETWNITLATQGPFATSSRVQGRLDYIAMSYTAPLHLNNGFVRFGEGFSGTGTGTGSSSSVTKKYSGATTFSNISGNAGDDIKVMRLGRRGKPACLIPTQQGEGGLTFTIEDGTETFIAFNPNHVFPEPTPGQSIINQDLHATNGVDMVIIVPASGKLTAQAQRLADAHKQYGDLNSIVVRADQIYNEYSSGTPDATAYRRFLKMLYDRGMTAGTAPRYLLLMGDCAWDNRMKSQTWNTLAPEDYLLCNQSEISYSDTQAYCWEDYFGLMDDGEGGKPIKDVSDIAIGRFPVTTEEQAAIVVDKTIAHLQKANAGEWRNKVVILGDDGDENTHMRDANLVADRIAESAPDVDIYKVMWDNYTRKNEGLYFSYPEVRSLVAKHVEEGAMMFNYTGHGSTYLMSHERVITLDDMNTWKSNRLPLWFVAACDITPFDSQESNFGETAMLSKDAVAVAFIGTTHTVYSSQNYRLNNFFSQYLFGNDANGKRNSVGEALRKAKESMVHNNTDGSQPQNKLQYALLGDPALVFGNLEAKVVLDSINGETITGKQQLQGGSHVRLSGHIERGQGVVDTNFNGTLYVHLYDSKVQITTKGNASDEPFTYIDWGNEINQTTSTISNGKFSATMIIPKDISYSDENGRLVFYALDNSNTIEANGSSEQFLVGGYSSELSNDTIGPEVFMYLDNENFMDGDAVSRKPIFVAKLYDESGIQSSGNGIGHDLQLCIDGDPKQTYNLNPYYTQAYGDYSKGNVYFADMPELEIGAHWLSFRAWDMMNNTSLKNLRFVVGENIEPEILSLMMDEDIVSGHVNFHIGYDMPGLECSFTLEIFSISGSVQWRQEICTSSDSGIVTIPWAGCNGDDASLNRGIYICRVTASYDNGKKSHKEKKFILKSNK